MAYTLTLQKSITRDPVSSLVTSMRVTLIVSAVTGFLDKGLFLFQSVDDVLNFQTACSAEHLANYRLTVVDPVTKFVRADNCSVTVDGVDAAEDFVTSMEDSLTTLCRSMAVLRDNINITTVSISE